MCGIPSKQPIQEHLIRLARRLLLDPVATVQTDHVHVRHEVLMEELGQCLGDFAGISDSCATGCTSYFRDTAPRTGDAQPTDPSRDGQAVDHNGVHRLPVPRVLMLVCSRAAHRPALLSEVYTVIICCAAACILCSTSSMNRTSPPSSAESENENQPPSEFVSRTIVSSNHVLDGFVSI